MTIHLLDTNILSHAARRHPATLGRLRAASPSLLRISTLTVLEVEYGLAKNPGTRVADAMRSLLRDLEEVPFDGACARAAARIRLDVTLKGTPIGAYDLLIASTAVARGWTLVTANFSELVRVPGLAIEDWTRA